MLAGVWTWVRLPPAPLLIGETLLNQRFFILFFGILLQKKNTTFCCILNIKSSPEFS